MSNSYFLLWHIHYMAMGSRRTFWYRGDTWSELPGYYEARWRVGTTISKWERGWASTVVGEGASTVAGIEIEFVLWSRQVTVMIWLLLEDGTNGFRTYKDNYTWLIENVYFCRLQKFAISRKPMGNSFARERICPHSSHNINWDFDISS